MQFRLATLLWLTLVVAAFFAGRRAEKLSRETRRPAPMFGVGVDSDAGVIGSIVIDDES